MGEWHWRYGSGRLEVHSMSTTALFQWIVHCIATKEMMHLIVNPIQIPFFFSFWLEGPNLQNNLSNLNMPPCQNHKQPGVLSSQLCLLWVPANSPNMSITKKKKKKKDYIRNSFPIMSLNGNPHTKTFIVSKLHLLHLWIKNACFSLVAAEALNPVLSSKRNMQISWCTQSTWHKSKRWEYLSK